MRFAPLPLATVLLSFLPSVASLECPQGTYDSTVRQGNTLTLSCLDSDGRPHGPFEVWAYPDTLLSGQKVLIVEGRFEHGKKHRTWTMYAKDGNILDRSEFNMGIKQGAANGAP